jgi:hypothetical protein
MRHVGEGDADCDQDRRGRATTQASVFGGDCGGEDGGGDGADDAGDHAGEVSA